VTLADGTTQRIDPWALRRTEQKRLSLAKTAVTQLLLTIANTSRQEPSSDTTETSYADAATNTFAFKRRGALTDGCCVQTRSETLTSRRCPSGTARRS
jgi:hypothetical protein